MGFLRLLVILIVIALIALAALYFYGASLSVAPSPRETPIELGTARS